MRYMLLLYNEALGPGEVTPELWQNAIRAHTNFTAALKEAGAYVSSAPLQPVESAKTVRLKRREQLVTDGPFAETKEQLGGYYLIEADSMDAAVAWAHELEPVADGSIEVRPVMQHIAVDSPPGRSS